MLKKAHSVKKYQFIFLVVSLFLSSISCVAQDKLRDYEERFSVALKVLDDGRYEEALELYLQLDSIPEERLFTNDAQTSLKSIRRTKFLVKRHIVECYVAIPNQNAKALVFIEQIINSEFQNILEMSFKDVANVYFYDYQFDKAIDFFEKSLKDAKERNDFGDYDRRMIEVCKNAKELVLHDTLGHITQNIDKPINFVNESEVSPYVSADEKIMYYKSVTYTKNGKTNIEIGRIMYSERNDFDIWSAPKEVQIPPIPNQTSCELAGLSPDGKKLLLNITINENSDIYICEVNKEVAGVPQPIRGEVNTIYFEGRAALSDDEKTLFFVSNRPSSYGGADLYVAYKQTDGTWTNVENLGPVVNSKYDEDAPYFHQSSNTLFFSSKGHKTMGGFDIFSSVKNKDTNRWNVPKNMGFPINTVKDNKTFCVNKKSTWGYFSSSTYDKYDSHDIFKADIQQSYKLTVLKGELKGGTDFRDLNAKIIVVDVADNHRVKYVYDTRFKKGRYLMILSPGRDYDIIISDDSNLFLTQLIRIQVPKLTYFHEIFQTITISPVDMIDKKIGENLVVKNTFYDVTGLQTLTEQRKKEREDYFKHLLKLVEDLLRTSDSINVLNIADTQPLEQTTNISYSKLAQLVETAIKTTDTLTLRLLSKNAFDAQTYSRTYYLPVPLDKSLLNKIKVDDTLFTTAPCFDAKVKDNKDVLRKMIGKNMVNKNLFMDLKEEKGGGNKENTQDLLLHEIYFNTNEAKIDNKYMQNLKVVSEFLINHFDTPIEIIGYSDDIREYNPNMLLAEERVNAVVKVLESNGANLKKAVLLYRKSNEVNRIQNQKVDIKIQNNKP